jgi:small subunit ribosomal protein S1
MSDVFRTNDQVTDSTPNEFHQASHDLPPRGDDTGDRSFLDDQTAQEVEAALSGMSAEELAAITGDVKSPTASHSPEEIRQGKVVGIYDDDVFLDFGDKEQAVVPRSQFNPEEVLQIGEIVDVVVERYDEDSGLYIASRDGAIRKAHWDSLTKGAFVEGRITGMNKGGLEVNLNGIRAFMPASQVDIAHVKDISVFIGQHVTCKVMEISKKDRNVLVSRRKYQEKEQAESREKLLTELEEGQVRKGTIGSITDFGAFVDLGGVDGLIHISDLSYGQVGKVTDVVQKGQQVEVKVLKVDPQRKRISLGLKQIKPDPWSNVEVQYPVGTTCTVRVLRLEKFGAFVELEEGVEGLIPMSEMSWGRIGKPNEVVEKGQAVTAQVIRVEPDKRRLALSIKLVEADPWAEVLNSFPKNTVVEGKVTKCADFGAFVELVPGVEGLVHISELADTHVKQCSDVVKPGQEVKVRILGVNMDSRRISLSMKTADKPAAAAQPAEQAPPPKKKARKKPLRGGLSSHFEWQGQSINLG